MGASAWAEGNVVDAESVSDPENVSEPKKLIAAEAKAEVDLGDLESDDENVDKKVVESENGISASASASVSYKFDFGKKFEEFLAKWKEALKTEENNKENKDEETKSPFHYSFNVH